MTISQDTDAAAKAAAPASEIPSTSSEQQIGPSFPQPAATEAPTAAALASEAAKPIEMPRIIELPQPIEAVMKAAEALKADAAKAPVAPLEEPAVVPPVKEIAEESRPNRFALLAASVAFAGALGAMAGALGTSVFARGTVMETPVAGVDLAPVRDAIATLRSEMSAIKTSIELSNRSASAQLAKFNERLERIDRAQAAPAAQLKQAIEAIDRLEKRAAVQPGQTTGSVQQAAATATPAAAPAPEANRQRVIEGWIVRHVSRGTAVIQGRRIGAIEVEPGDVVPGVGRIESIRRQDGRWIVLTSNGMITSLTSR